jgi:hypothetical protein
MPPKKSTKTKRKQPTQTYASECEVLCVSSDILDNTNKETCYPVSEIEKVRHVYNCLDDNKGSRTTETAEPASCNPNNQKVPRCQKESDIHPLPDKVMVSPFLSNKRKREEDFDSKSAKKIGCEESERSTHGIFKSSEEECEDDYTKGSHRAVLETTLEGSGNSFEQETRLRNVPDYHNPDETGAKNISADGGWYDVEGNYVYPDYSYYDPQGVFHNPDGSLWVNPSNDQGDQQTSNLARSGSECLEGWNSMEEDSATKFCDSVSSHPFKIIDANALWSKLVVLVREMADQLSLSESETGCLLRYLQYNQAKIDQFQCETTFQQTVRVNSGLILRQPLQSPTGIRPTNSTQHWEPGTRKCPFCLLSDDQAESLPLSDMHSLSCGHYLCLPCWRGHLSAQKDEGKMLTCRCPAWTSNDKRCGDWVDAMTMEKLLDPEDFEMYKEMLVREWVQYTPTLKWCGNPRCGNAAEYDASEGGHIDIQCTCTFSFCFKCGLQPHSPIPCELAQKWNNWGLDTNASSERWIALNTKACPKCKVSTEKNRQCNHMKCPKCHHDWCWQCLAHLPKVGGQHPDWYTCLTTSDAVSNGTVDTKLADEAKFQSVKNLYEKKADDSMTVYGMLSRVSSQIVEREKDTNKVYLWLSNAVEDLKTACLFLKWCHVLAFFLEHSTHKAMLEERVSSLHKLCKETQQLLTRTVGSKETFLDYFDDLKSTSTLMSSIYAIKSLRKGILNHVDASQLTQIIRYEPEKRADQW